MNRFKSWEALLWFGLFVCPVPLFGQVCVVAALIWRARSGWFRSLTAKRAAALAAGLHVAPALILHLPAVEPHSWIVAAPSG